MNVNEYPNGFTRIVSGNTCRVNASLVCSSHNFQSSVYVAVNVITVTTGKRHSCTAIQYYSLDKLSGHLQTDTFQLCHRYS